MRVPLAWRNLRHQPTRSLVAVAGVGFALLLIFMQLGFYGAVERTATQLYGVLDFDVMLISSQYVDLNQSDRFPGERLRQAASDPGVESAAPVGIGFLFWRIVAPDRPDIDGTTRSLLAVGFDPDDNPFRPDNFSDPQGTAAVLPLLDEPRAALFDTRSRDEFGDTTAGVRSELGGVLVEVKGQFTLGTGFSADGLVFIDDATYRRALGIDLNDRPNLGLLRLKPGADPEEVARRINARGWPDVRAVTREGMLAAEQRHWVENTSVGIIFRIGVGVALIVGVVFVYQVMAGDISNHLPEYATLKAMGYSDGYLSRVVVQQALILALLGYIPGMLAALGLYAVARPNGIPAYMTLPTAAQVLAMSLAMCVASAMLAVRKAKQADPAELF